MLSDAEDNDNEDSGDDENELEKEMGDLGEDQADKLDDQMWGSDDEDEQQENSKFNELTTEGLTEVQTVYLDCLDWKDLCASKTYEN